MRSIKKNDTLLHATINGKKTCDIDWDGKNQQGLLNNQTFTWNKKSERDDLFHVIHHNKSYRLEIVSHNTETKEAVVKVNGNKYHVQLKDRYDDLLKSLGMEGSGSKKMKDLKAPMPGMVLDVLVSPGQLVEKDTPLLILEAMKMENVIKSPAAAEVKSIAAVKGNAVEKNAVLIEFA
ncbi:MAG: acetyl-CoA carboxylase biotin carboxyl carrier protein subunit [Flavobacteriales bacterium]